MVTRKRVEQPEEEAPVEKATKREVPKWRVKSGGITLLNHKSYSKGDVFDAEDWEVPQAFRDLVELLTPELLTKKSVREPQFFLEEVEATDEEKDEKDFVPLYEVVNADGKVISEKPLPKDKAAVLLKAFNK